MKDNQSQNHREKNKGVIERFVRKKKKKKKRDINIKL